MFTYMLTTNDELKLDHLFNLTDSTGMIQHCRFCVPDFENGYTTDDNARALIIASMLYNKFEDERFVPLIIRYLSFLHYGQNNNGKWKNFMNYQRQFIEEVGSEDSFGRSLWGLSYVYTLNNPPKGVLELTDYLVKGALPNIEGLKAYRAQAYSLLGLCNIYEGHDKVLCKNLIENLGNKLVSLYNSNKSDDWYWFEDEITYANGIMPYCLLKAYQIVEKEEYYKTALEILDFLDSIVMKDGYLKLVGCNGWAVKDCPVAQFDEQPVDAADMVLAYSEAYKVTDNSSYLEKAEISLKWFHGLNCHSIPMVNPDIGGSFDGITRTGINMNQGAESLFAYVMSYLTAEEMGIVSIGETEKDDSTFEEAV